MPAVTPFSLRVRADLRESLLEAATAQLAAQGYRRLRMADVAAAVGVSRQTVYNEFGDKEQLAQAVLLRCTTAFLADIDAAMAPADSPREGIRAGALAALEHAERDPLIVALVTGASSDLLPFLADHHAEPVLRAAADSVTRHLGRLADGGPHDLVATAVVRLVISHMLLPTASPADAAAEVADLAATALGQHHRMKE